MKRFRLGYDKYTDEYEMMDDDEGHYVRFNEAFEYIQELEKRIAYYQKKEQDAKG